MIDTEQLRNDLREFHGSETAYVHALNRKVFYTEGVRHFAQNAGGGAYWLLDILASQPEILNQVRDDRFANIVLRVGTDKKAALLVDDGNDNPVYIRHLDFTDCPAGEWQFYMESTVVGDVAGAMVMVPGER